MDIQHPGQVSTLKLNARRTRATRQGPALCRGQGLPIAAVISFTQTGEPHQKQAVVEAAFGALLDIYEQQKVGTASRC